MVSVIIPATTFLKIFILFPCANTFLFWPKVCYFCEEFDNFPLAMDESINKDLPTVSQFNNGFKILFGQVWTKKDIRFQSPNQINIDMLLIFGFSNPDIIREIKYCSVPGLWGEVWIVEEANNLNFPIFFFHHSAPVIVNKWTSSKLATMHFIQLQTFGRQDFLVFFQIQNCIFDPFAKYFFQYKIVLFHVYKSSFSLSP